MGVSINHSTVRKSSTPPKTASPKSAPFTPVSDLTRITDNFHDLPPFPDLSSSQETKSQSPIEELQVLFDNFQKHS